MNLNSYWFEDCKKFFMFGFDCKKIICEYFNENVWIIIFGYFFIIIFNFCCNEVGSDRIFFLVDYLFEKFEDVCDWFDNMEINMVDRKKIGWENVKKLFKLG